MRKLSPDYVRQLEATEAAEIAAGKPSTHPYAILLNFALGKDPEGKPFAPGEGPSISTRTDCLNYLLRTRLPVLSKAEHQAEVTNNSKPAAIGRLDVLNALLAASPQERALILGQKKPLQIGESSDI